MTLAVCGTLNLKSIDQVFYHLTARLCACMDRIKLALILRGGVVVVKYYLFHFRYTEHTRS